VEDKRTETTGGLLSPSDLARYLSCSRTFAATLISSGTIPSLRIHGLRRVRKCDVDSYIEARLAAKE
jgi:excisionase family DNA binding protein